MESDWKWWKLLLSAAGMVGGMVALATQVSAEQGASNLASWLKWLHLPDPAGLLRSPDADRWGLLIGLFLVALAVAGFGLHWWRKKNHAPNLDRVSKDAARQSFGPSPRPFSQMSDTELGAECIELARHFSMKGDKTETTHFVNAQHMYAEAMLFNKELRDRGFLQATIAFSEGDTVKNFNDFAAYLTQLGTFLVRGQPDTARRFALSNAYSVMQPVAPKVHEQPLETVKPDVIPAARNPAYESLSISGMFARAQRENQEVRIQRALERDRLERAKAADYLAWDRVVLLSLRQAAYLWSGERPPEKDDDMSQMARIILRELVSAADNEDLKATPPSYPQWVPAVAKVVAELSGTKLGEHDLHSVATRDDLRSYAIGRNERPLFLFPEDR